MAIRTSPAKSGRNGSANTMSRSSGAHGNGRTQQRSSSCPGFDARNLPSLDPKDFQWGTPTVAQQQQLYTQYMQMSFMYASSMHPMSGLPSWPMMMPACPGYPPPFHHPSVFASCPPPGFMPPVMGPIAAPMPSSSSQQVQQGPNPAAPKTPATVAKPAAAVTKRPAALSRLSSDVSDTTDCRSGMGGTEGGQDVAWAGRSSVSRTQEDAAFCPATAAAAVGTSADQQQHQQQQPPCAMQLSVDELQLLFADDSFLTMEEMDTCSADEGSRHLSHSSNGASPTGSSLASACAMGGGGGARGLLLKRAGSQHHHDAAGVLRSQSLIHTSVSEIDPCLFAVDGEGDDEDDGSVADLHQHFGGLRGGGGCGGPSAEVGACGGLDGALSIASGEASCCAPPATPSTPLRFPPHKTGLRTRRRAACAPGGSAFAALAAHLMAGANDDDVALLVASDCRQLQVVPDRTARPAPKSGGTAAAVAGRLSGGVRKTRSSCSLAAPSPLRSRMSCSPSPELLPAAAASTGAALLEELEPLALLDGMLGCGANDRSCDDWDAVMFMDLDAALNPMDVME